MAEVWYQDVNLLSSFGTVLKDAGVLEDADDFRDYLNKPFKYNDEYDAWEEAGFPDEGTDNWDTFVDAISSEEDEVEPNATE